MTSLSELLEWKFPNTPGLRTREDGLGGVEIFDWPGPGPTPNAQQIAAWQAEFDNAPTLPDPVEAATTLDELKIALIDRIKPHNPRNKGR